MIPSFYQIGDKLVAARDIKLTNDGRPYYSLNARVIKLEDAEPGMISHSRPWTASEAVHYQSTNASIKPKTSLNWAAPSQPRQQKCRADSCGDTHAESCSCFRPCSCGNFTSASTSYGAARACRELCCKSDGGACDDG